MSNDAADAAGQSFRETPEPDVEQPHDAQLTEKRWSLRISWGEQCAGLCELYRERVDPRDQDGELVADRLFCLRFEPCMRELMGSPEGTEIIGGILQAIASVSSRGPKLRETDDVRPDEGAFSDLASAELERSRDRILRHLEVLEQEIRSRVCPPKRSDLTPPLHVIQGMSEGKPEGTE